MGKGTQTREKILEQAAPIFNRQGYSGTSLSDIMHETGLEKGGIYNHFASKEQLALEAFDYAFELHKQRIQRLLQDKKHAIDRLSALVAYFQSVLDDPPVEGGCPILNTAIEADDAHPALRERACNAMDILRGTFVHIITKGILRKEIRPHIDPDACASLFIASLEGALMLSKLYQNGIHTRYIVDHLTQYIETEMRLALG